MLKHLKIDPYFSPLRKKRIGVLMGGRSAEREVSLMSGRGVMAALRRLKFDCVAIDAATNLEQKLIAEKINIAFIALHGRWGEDGIVQGLLEYMNIPYVGSGVLSSSLANDKVTAKRLFINAGIPTSPFYVIDTFGDLKKEANQGAQLGFPLILKPRDEGSSIGCHLIRNKKEFVHYVKKERRRYPRLFVEKFIRGMEVTIGIINKTGRDLVLPVLELSTKRAFYDYKAKYSQGFTDFIIPARIPGRLTKQLENITLQVHEVLNCHGVSRTDFIINTKNKKLYVLELQTLPGLTALSDLPAQARAAGMTYDELIYWILASSLTAKRSFKKAIYYD
jgi:D-alanine-D-alanine ligase